MYESWKLYLDFLRDDDNIFLLHSGFYVIFNYNCEELICIRI